jgi:hypothetical protein
LSENIYKKEWEMNYWIFVHRGKNVSADKTFPQLLENKNWGFKSSRPVKSKIASLQEGDIVVFYIGGHNCKVFSGEARLVSSAYPPTRTSIGGPANYKLDSMVSFDEIDLWNSQRLYLTKDVRDQLDFIKNKDNWGMTFGQSIIKISKSAYDQIKKVISNYGTR